MVVDIFRNANSWVLINLHYFWTNKDFSVYDKLLPSVEIKIKAVDSKENVCQELISVWLWLGYVRTTYIWKKICNIVGFLDVKWTLNAICINIIRWYSQWGYLVEYARAVVMAKREIANKITDKSSLLLERSRFYRYYVTIFMECVSCVLGEKYLSSLRLKCCVSLCESFGLLLVNAWNCYM